MREEIKVIIGGNSEGAQQAIQEVGNKAESVLGKRMGSIVSKAFSALPMAGMVAGVALVGQEVLEVGAKATAVSDKFASIKARINLINDGSQSTASIMDKVYQASERTRGSYTDMLDSVAKLNMLAKDSFTSNDEAIRFVEQLNMQFKLSGANVNEISSAVTQLTQAMAAGRLQGDEFNSVMENAPMLAQAISQEMGVPIGQLKELGSEGAITAEVIKNALFNSADETQAKFNEMPMTFQEVGQQLSNAMFQAFQPVMEELSSMTASEDFKTAIDGIGIAIQAMSIVATGAIALVKVAFAGIKAVISGTVAHIKMVGTVLKGIFGAPSQAIRTFGVLLVGLAGYLVGVRIASMAFASGLTVQKVAMMAMTAVTKAGQLATMAYNGTIMALKVIMFATGFAIMAVVKPMQFMKGLMVAVRSSTLATAGAQGILNAVMRMNPIPILVGLLAVLAAAFIGPKIATEGLGATMSSIWNSIVHTVTWAINQIIRFINKLTSAFNSVSGVISKVLNVDIGKFGEISEISADDAEGFANKTQEVFGDMASAFTGGGGTTTAETATESSGGGGGGGSAGGGGSDNSLQQAIEEAKRAHEQMTDSYRQMFGTKVDEVEAWRKKELEELDKSKAQNVNYNEDLRMLNEMYAKKREQALYEEAKRVREIKKEISDMDVAFNIKIATTDSTGSVSPFEKLNQEHAEAMREIANRHQKMSDDFAEKTDRDKKVWLDSLKEQNIAYELSEDGRITYSERKRQEELAQLELFNKKRAEIARTGAETEFAIQEALRTQNFDALKTALTDEYVEQQNSYEMKKDLMNQYIEAVKESHFSLHEVMDKSVMAGMNTLSDSISGLLQGTATLSSAIQNLGKAMLKAVADYIANWAAQSLKSLVFGQMIQKKQEAASIASASAQIPYWSKLALQMSMATAGASATAGMTAYTTATSAGTAMGGMLGGNFLTGRMDFSGGQIQPKMKMATGGLAYGRTFAEIGEGQYPEAVLPLSDTVFSRLGEGIRENGGGSNITLNVSAIDAHSFGSWLEHTGGKVLRQFTANTEREFGSEVGVW
ncbi:tape measure protein [Veillonella sp. CHU594]|uniref:tape measure protein n=1 Tax=Veillonella sp. CHU594 TaxID=2490948 RepID=UPI000F8C9CA6|nr:tape measure protein [Veillonella sp. CHU594]